jgi:hypothetical protein
MESTFQNKNVLNALPALWAERPREKSDSDKPIGGIAYT